MTAVEFMPLAEVSECRLVIESIANSTNILLTTYKCGEANSVMLSISDAMYLSHILRTFVVTEES